MTRYIAFLRSINVGGRTVKMDRLRQLFESVGFSNVETFLASGNVMFEARSGDTKTFERKIETALKEALGYEVVTFVRSKAELADIAAYTPFRDSKGDAGLYVAFVSEPPGDAVKQKLLARKTRTDDFRIHKREIYWLCRTKFSESEFSGPLLEKILATKATVRNVNTIRKIAATPIEPNAATPSRKRKS